MSLSTYHEFDHDGKHYRFVYDELYASEGSFCYDTEEETQAAVDEDRANLESGKWVALGVIVTEPCEHEHHCDSCEGTNETDSIWGIVIENSYAAAEAFVKEGGI